MELGYKELKERFPLTFKEKVRCGVWLPEGWNDLIIELCTKIEAILNKPENANKNFQVNQIKEKFGTLRFYWSGDIESWEEVNKLVGEAERATNHLCEQCGKEGQTRTGGWVRTLCDNCVRIEIK